MKGNYTLTLYQNKRNKNKFIEVKRYSDGHYYWRQFLHWFNGVTNYTGGDDKYHKQGIRWANPNVLETDYCIVCISEAGNGDEDFILRQAHMYCETEAEMLEEVKKNEK